MLYKSKILTLETMAYSWYVDEYISMGPRGRFHSYKCYIGLFGTGLYMGRALRTKETLSDFVRNVGSLDIHECFRGLTGSQQIPRIWGITGPPMSSCALRLPRRGSGV